MIDNLDRLWAELEAGTHGIGTTARRLTADAPVDIFVGIEAPSSTRVLFIQAHVAAFRAWDTRLPQSAGITVTLEQGSGAGGRHRLVVRLTASSYRDVFSVLVSDLLRVVELSPGETAAVLTLTSTVQPEN